VKERVITWLVPRLIWLIHLFLTRTILWERVGTPYDPNQQQHFIMTVWHARILVMPYGFRGWPGYMLASQHRDGRFIADAVGLMGIEAIYGSSTRGGARAMLEMVRRVRRENCDLGITPDGPKGPREVVQPGVAQLAMKTGLPVWPVCAATRRHWRANSWDRFYIPKPFTRGVLVYGDYLYIDRDEPADQAVARIQAAMDEVQRRADTYFD